MSVGTAEVEAVDATGAGAPRRGRPPGAWGQRKHVITVTMSDAERAELEARARASGASTLAGYIRLSALGRGAAA